MSNFCFFAVDQRTCCLPAASAAAASAAASGLYPTDDLAAAKVDAIMDSSTDLGANIRPSFMEKDTAKKVNTYEYRQRSQNILLVEQKVIQSRREAECSGVLLSCHSFFVFGLNVFVCPAPDMAFALRHRASRKFGNVACVPVPSNSCLSFWPVGHALFSRMPIVISLTMR